VSAPFPAFELARKVADAVLYEGYLLYPYRASAAKNQARWQFGVLMPRLWSESGPDEPWATQTECLLEAEETSTVRVLVRFLHVQAKTVEAVDVEAGTFHEVPALSVDGSELVPWDEATEQEVTVEAPLARLLEGGELVTPFERPGGRRVEPVHTPAGKLVGRTVRRRCPVLGAVRLSAERLEGPYGLVRLRVRLENASAWHEPTAGGGKRRGGGAVGGRKTSRRCGARWSRPTACWASTAGCSCPCSTRRSGPSRPPRPARTSTPGRC
jgi:hypothetical protein